MGGVLFICTVLINSGLQVICYKVPLPVMVYDNPLVVLGALGLFLYFNGLHIKYSSFINFVAKSSFAVFLLHTNPNIGEPIYKPLCISIFESYSGVECLVAFLLLLMGIYVSAILLDVPRRYIWKRLSGGAKM